MPASYDATQLQSMFQKINERLRAIEAQVSLLSDKAGIPFELPSEGAPNEVIELVVAGKKLEAIKLYRELTGADFETARDAVDSI